MRELKFRAWSRKKKAMLELACTIRSNDTIYLQHIGLKDKNGKEIYEGDIVEADWGYGCPKQAVELETVYYARGECCISNDIRVIGNIYENSELLKGA